MKTNPDGGEHALDMGDLIADAGYYRLTKSEADREYARMKSQVGSAEEFRYCSGNEIG